jgi:hypothetical protein
MDARTVAEIADIDVGTLNVWVQRGLIPGMKTGARGRQRDFDLDTATHILIIAHLVRLGLGAPLASVITHFLQTSMSRDHKYLLFGKDPEKPVDWAPRQTGTQPLRQMVFSFFDTLDELPGALERFPGGPPSVYVLIHLETLEKQMRQAYKEWEWREDR